MEKNKPFKFNWRDRCSACMWNCSTFLLHPATSLTSLLCIWYKQTGSLVRMANKTLSTEWLPLLFSLLRPGECETELPSWKPLHCYWYSYRRFEGMTFRHWRSMKYFPPRRRQTSTKLHADMSEKIMLIIESTVRSCNLRSGCLFSMP
jgi:hypothetical protein